MTMPFSAAAGAAELALELAPEALVGVVAEAGDAEQDESPARLANTVSGRQHDALQLHRADPAVAAADGQA